ncbi:MAG: amidase, partial [Acidobacteria bacterium]|nr:amidase [Acidobacteriota bacterium]
EARELADRFPAPAGRPPLFGVPIGVKDIFNVDGFATHAGSQLPATEFTGPEASSVTALRRAGALILGKTVTTEFAYFAPGPTRNPVDPARTPGGSSSGSAAAVGADLCPLALGTQTIGSISRPASFCGVVGFKPTYDRTSRQGVIPLAPSVDHIGCFTTDMAGARLAAASLCLNWRPTPTLGRPRMAIPESPYLGRASRAGRERFRQACEGLVEQGFEIANVLVMADFDAIEARHQLLVAGEAAQVHAQWFEPYGDTYHAQTRRLIETGRKVTADDLARAVAGREALRDELTAAMDEHRIDLWLSPASPDVAPLGLESTGDPVMNLPWTHAGLPTVSLPLPCAEGEFPFGLQLAGRWGADEELLAWADGLERALAA